MKMIKWFFKERSKEVLEHWQIVAERNPLPSKFAERMVFNIIEHPEICSWKISRPSKYNEINQVIISQKVEEWLAYNIKGAYNTKSSDAANFMAEIEFESSSDATLFKMFWL